MEERLKKVVITLVLLLVIFGFREFFEERAKQNKGNFKILISMVPQDIMTFRIYPGVIKPVGAPLEFRYPDAMIEEFFQALTDIQAYSPSHDTAWQEQQWFIEVSAKDIEKMIPLQFYIPSRQKNIVVANTMGDDGYFQSRKLFQWYQAYSHRWLGAGEREEEDKKVRR